MAEGVFCALPGGTAYYVSNSVAIVGEDGVLLVDSGAGPNEARVLREGIRTLTDRPVRYVVDTHFHFDHAFGHQAFPEALVVGHDATRRPAGPDALRGPTVAGYLASLPGADRQALGRRRGMRRIPPSARSSRSASRAWHAYQQELSQLRSHRSQPHVQRRLTIWLGQREVGCCISVAATPPETWSSTCPRTAWSAPATSSTATSATWATPTWTSGPTSLDRLAALDFETVIAGHGEPFKGKEAIGPVQACLRDLWRQAEQQKRAGASAEEAATRIDLRAHASRFPRLSQVGFEPVAVRRIYQVLDERASAGGAR